MSKDKKESVPQLGSSPADLTASILRGMASTILGAGGAISEIVNHIVPNQRLDRLEDFASKLERRLSCIESNEQIEALKQPDAVALFEEGAIQAAHAVSMMRRERIANLVGYGMSGDEKDRIESLRLLKILGQLDDDQIIILSSYLNKNRFDERFWERHSDVLNPKPAHLGSSDEEFERATISKLARVQLRELRLLKSRYRKPKKGKLPEFDFTTGMVKASTTDLTPLGRLLLTRLGLADPPDK
jgi:hypothetical protein